MTFVHWQVFLLSVIPLLELRASIPYGFLADLSPLVVLLLSIIGSWLPAFFVVFVLEHIEPFLRKIKLLNAFLDRLYAKTRSKSENIRRWEFWGLVLFIGVPLPGTGVWTGSLAGYLLGLDKTKVIIASLLGTTLAGTIMAVLMSTGVWVIHSVT
ncbi:small multidrug export protein [Candidatus Termititenax persephonae]|uniref:Small multidrug export protein n=1 Tax=Candidatus Termititenax persephonae TaxID=2218525 RepID=A0A388TFM0_9BACT|nr:small multidrug export protein [Candidatus Termititenax persephonae]